MATLAAALERKDRPRLGVSTNYDMDKREPWEIRLTNRVLGYIRSADVGEDARRRSDRLGGNLTYGFHWSRPMPSDRAAITANLAFAIVRHKVAIMTKQDPLPVIEPDDVGDAYAAQLMCKVLQRLWKTTRMREKLRRLATLANATRTCAFKVSWDPVAKGGAGDIATDVIAGWNLVLDNRVGSPEMMEYCGNRATMTRSRAMLAYPDAAEQIRGLTDAQSTKKLGSLFGNGTPIATPWKQTYLPPPGATIVNGKPVVTAFAGELTQGVDIDNLVDLIEMYHKDHTLIEKLMPVRDGHGKIKRKMVRDESGMPQFDEAEPELHTMPDGSIVELPRFKLAMEDEMETQFVRKYPYWRRTTVCMSGGQGVMIEDREWDRVLPFAFYTDIEPLDGILGRGSLLQTEHLQALINVGLSTVTDTLRFGALNAWLAGSSSGLTTSQIIPGIGQVIPVNDLNAIQPLPTKALDPQFFTLLDRTVNYMERILGATGVMQGESMGRLDSGSGYDTLAEIGGSTLTECTQRLMTTVGTWAEIAGGFAQDFYDERHAIAVEDNEGNITWERASSALLNGSFSYNIAEGSSMAWSESAKQARLLGEFQAGILDRQSYFEETHKPNWRQILTRIEQVGGPQAAIGPAASPPIRMRATANKRPPA